MALGGVGRRAMGRYFASRTVEVIVTLAVMSLVVYLLIGLMPGDPIDMMISGDPRMTSADAARLRALYGIDKPLLERYVAWAHQALIGNFGYSRSFGQPVLAVLGPRLLNTLELAGLAFLLSAGAALPLGIWAAARPRSRVDYLINLFCFAGISTPAFWLALLLITLFAVTLGWLPAGGMADLRTGMSWAAAFGQKARFALLPVLTLALVQLGTYTRFMRGAMIETLRQDYIRTARAKGVPERRVLLRHAFVNALAPVLTVLGLSFGSLFSGALITETMFAWPGMGRMIYQAILDNDYNLALVGLLIATFATIAGNLLADLALVWIDPRVSLGGEQ
jgi:peptide/nickel transport system permease protein